MNRWNRFLLLAGFTLAAASTRAQEEVPPPDWLRKVVVTLDAPEKGQQVLSICMTPGVTQTYEQLRFECIYRQEFDWTDSAGRKLRRTHEPVRFTYERDDVRLTNDLDTHVSFKAPIGVEVLRGRFGNNAFRPDVPITIPRVRIEARSAGSAVWAYEVATTPEPQVLDGKHRVDVEKIPAKPRSKPSGDRAKFGTVDLD